MQQMWIIIVFILISLMKAGFAEDVLENRLKAIRELGAMEERKRLDILSQFSKERSKIEQTLITLLSSQKETDAAFAAAYLLGIYRMERSVPALAQAIALQDKRNRITDGEPLWEKYPAVEALIRIGKPSITSMLDLIQTKDDAKIRDLATMVIFHVEGHDVSEFIINNYIEKQTELGKKDRLKIALQFVNDETARRTPSSNK